MNRTLTFLMFLSSSGGISYYHIYSLKGGKTKLLFSPTPESAIVVKGSFEDDYKVRMTVQQTGKVYTLDVNDKNSTHYDQRMSLYSNGKLLKHVDVQADYYGLITPVDTDKDGIYELLMVFPQPTKENPDPVMDYYSVLYPAGTVNQMADDQGRQW